MLSTTNSNELYSLAQEQSSSTQKRLPSTKLNLSNCCSPEFRPYRYLICILVCLIEAIFVYSLEFIIGLEPIIIKVMKLSHSQYNLIFSAYSWCDIVMSLVGSILVNKYLGIRLGLVIFTTISTIGQTAVSFGAYINSFYVVLLGRVVLGCGIGAKSSIAYSYLIKWFNGKEITFVMSISRCCSRLAATMALLTPALIYHLFGFTLTDPYYCLGTTTMISSVICMCSVGISIIVAFLDKHGDNRIIEDFKIKKDFKLTDIIHFPLNFWITALVIALFYSVSYVNAANAPLFFISKYQYSVLYANIANSLSYTSVIFITPFIGLAIDFTGYNLLWGLFGVSFSIILNLLYVTTDYKKSLVPFITATLYSFSYSFTGTAMFVTIGFFVSSHHVVSAFGFAMSIHAATASIVGFLSGMIIDMFGYISFYLFHIILLSVVSYLMIYLTVSEVATGDRILNISGKTRRLKEG